ncbi:MAG: magnesium transporter [Erysipelotrichaceae bacterium]|nr:magnesium transporter [Erysipelotrichaceae bacterium]
MEQEFVTVASLKEWIEQKNIRKIRELFDEYHVVDVTELVQQLSLAEIIFLFKVVKRDVTAEVFTYLDQEKKEELIQAFSGPDIKIMLENIYSDDIVDFIEDMPANLTKKILASATESTRKEINLLLSFPENSAGSIMSTDFVELKVTDTVQQAINKIKRQGKMAETINTCYVIDEKRQLVGTIRLREFLFENREDKIQDIMATDVVSVVTDQDQEDVANVIKKYDITVVPVVNNENRLIGIITVDDIMDILEEEATEDIHKMAAVTPMEDSYLEASVWEIVKSRLPWLLILMISGSFTGAIISGYEVELMKIPALAGFIPMIMGTAGNAGSQASTMVIRGIAVDGLQTKDVFKVLRKELLIALTCSVVLFSVNFIRISVFPSELVAASNVILVALTVALSVVLALTIGKLLGGFLPLFVCALKLDPAAVAAPVITTLVDACSLFIYFQIAVFFLGV